MTPVLETPAKSSRAAYVTLLVSAALIVLCYAPAILSLFHDWLTDDDMGHGFFLPLVAGYIIWQERDELKRIPLRTNWWGLVVVGLGGAQSLVATLGSEDSFR